MCSQIKFQNCLEFIVVVQFMFKMPIFLNKLFRNFPYLKNFKFSKLKEGQSKLLQFFCGLIFHHKLVLICLLK